MTNDTTPISTGIRLGRIELFPAERQLLIDDKPTRIGARAFDLLHALLSHPGEVIGKQRLLETVWPDVIVEENNLQVQVCSLRRLLGAEAIVTVPGRGYVLAAHAHSRARTPSNGSLPTWRTDAGLGPLRGRTNDVPTLERQVATQRLVSVVGPGGVGKSRLVQDILGRMSTVFPEGVVSVELGALRRGTPVAGHVARALGGMDSRTRIAPHDVARLVGDRKLLLVLENCEHVPDGVGTLVKALLSQAPNVHMLLTSQSPLNMPGEHLLRLSPLLVPAVGDESRARTSPAVQLLEDTIGALQGDCALTDADLKDAAAICRHLDGLPLALEMAGVRVPMLGLAGVRRHLARRFDLLTSGSRSAPARHQSLKAALDWSWQLLDDEERAALRALCRFGKAFTLPMARAALANLGNEERVLAMVGRLTDKSFVGVARIGGRIKLQLLETVRLFVLGTAPA